MQSIREFIRIVETVEDDPRDMAILRDILSRANASAVRAWALENNWDESDMDTEDGFLWVFQQWLHDEHSLDVSNGMVEFYRLWNHNTERLIGENPVLLYHFTSSLRVPSIRRDGLTGGRRSVNRRQSEGVYLTTETSGPAISGYIRNALKGSRRAYGVRLHIRTFMSELAPDPDDEDISSGATQFVTDYVAPQQIVSIERA